MVIELNRHILLTETIKQNIVEFIGYGWKCNVNDIIMDPYNFHKHQHV